MLGIMKTGNAYVPLDPNYPASRVAFMAQDSCLSLVITYLPPRLAAVVLFCTDVCCCMDPAVPPRFVLPAMEPAVDATEPPPFTPLLLEAAVEPRLARLPRRPPLCESVIATLQDISV